MDLNYKRIAEETMRISRQGYYLLKSGEKIELVGNKYGAFDVVEVFDTEKFESILEDEEGFFEKTFLGKMNRRFKVMESDSFEAAKLLEHPLVMNFANARHPGGGFLNGAHAQEESLCRCSTLYQSLISEKAAEMYRYNTLDQSPMDSDYMLLSPNVCVFRDAEYALLEEPFNVAVWTIAALNLKGRSRNVEQSVIDEVMKERLRFFFLAAARRGYRNLVLGAWGCGAFGHNPEVVAEYFREVLIEEQFDAFFDNIIFAIKGKGRNLNAFMDVFAEKVDIYRNYMREKSAEKMTVENCFEAKYPFPICNHTQGMGLFNVGYTQGITRDGIPFEAELISNSNEDAIQIILPDIYGNVDDEVNSVDNSKMLGFRRKVERSDNGILQIGMVDNGINYNLNAVQKYIDYFERMGIVRFLSGYYNGAAWSLTDIEGHDLVCVFITLKDNNRTYAECHLNFRNFLEQKRKQKADIIPITRGDGVMVKQMDDLTEQKRQALKLLAEERKHCNACAKIQQKIKLFNSAENAALDSDTIGPWTKWNGNPNAEYMIVGQDWGTKDYLEKFRAWQKTHNNLSYESYDITNKNLAACIKKLNVDWDILEEDGIENNERYPLYFTNEILCFKEAQLMNESIPAACFQECSKKFLLKQIDIVSPKALVLLGADTFRNFVKAAGKDAFNCAIDLNAKFADIVSEVLKDKMQIVYTTDSGKNVRVFPMWHTGGLGAANAKRANTDKTKTALEILEEQWEMMSKLL